MMALFLLITAVGGGIDRGRAQTNSEDSGWGAGDGEDGKMDLDGKLAGKVSLMQRP